MAKRDKSEAAKKASELLKSLDKVVTAADKWVKDGKKLLEACRDMMGEADEPDDKGK
jgi:hypothetical protein